jgi:hypothetical protein
MNLFVLAKIRTSTDAAGQSPSRSAPAARA